MNLRPLLFSILFGCAACTPVQSSTNDEPKKTVKWAPFPPQHPEKVHEPVVKYVDQMHVFDHKCTSDAIRYAWANKGEKMVDWPDDKDAYATTFRKQPAIIIENVVWIGQRTKFNNDLNVLRDVGQLLASGTKKGLPGRATIYVVRKRMGDSLEEARQRHLSDARMSALIKEAGVYYRSIGVFQGAINGGDIRTEFAYEKNVEGHYVRAHRIAWRGTHPTNSLPEAEKVHVCDVKW